MIGDVCGKGPEAASVTALARHTLRAAAAFEHRPSRVLSLLHRALRDQRGDGRFCTVAYAHLGSCRAACASTLACGGHPLPLVVRQDGRSSRSAQLGTLLGADIEPQLTEVTVELGEGDALVLYTDGVTEVRRRAARSSATRDLAGLLATCGGLPPDAVAERVEAGRAHRRGGPPPRRHRHPRPRSHALTRMDPVRLALDNPYGGSDEQSRVGRPRRTTETSAALLRELVAHLRENRTQLREEWARRIPRRGC